MNRAKTNCIDCIGDQLEPSSSCCSAPGGVYNDFAVSGSLDVCFCGTCVLVVATRFGSGEYKTPGAPLAPDNGPLKSIEAAEPGLISHAVQHVP